MAEAAAEDLFLDRAMELESEMFPNQPDGFPFGEVDLNAVKLPKGEDMGIPSDDDLSDEEEINEETGFGSVIGEAIHTSLCLHLNQICKECSHLDVKHLNLLL